MRSTRARMFAPLTLLSLFTFATAVPHTPRSSSCVGTISSLSDVSTAVQCATVNIQSFTVPAGETFSLDLLQGTTVNVLGDIQFGNESWAGPLFTVQGENITFNGNGKRWNGGGPFYWDGQGGSGGVTKPSPMMQIRISGELSDVYVVNSPERCFSVNNVGELLITGVVVDDSQGDLPNDKSHGKPAGRNTDGFDVSGDNVTIKNCTVFNQDDCLAINRGNNIVFEGNRCEHGHGISIGSIGSDTVVENVVFRDNIVRDSMHAFRIKTKKTATNSRVTNVTYSGNIATNCTRYGLLIDESYPDSFGTPGPGAKISGINFSPDSITHLSVASDAKRVGVNCGIESCFGLWNWAGLKTSGGQPGDFVNVGGIGLSLSGYPVQSN